MFLRHGSRPRRALARTSAAAASALALVAVQASAASAAYSPHPLVGWVPDAVVRSVAVRGDVAYIGGSFTSLRNVRTGEVVAKSRLAAIQISTGQLIRGFGRPVNGDVLALAVSSDGTQVFLGGAFSQVAGSTHSRLAAVSATTGAPTPGWSGSANAAVRDLVATPTRVFAGGDFTAVSGVARGHVAALSPTTGSAISGFNPATDNRVDALALAPDGASLVVGGRFTTLAGGARTFLGSVDATTGGLRSWNPTKACTTGTSCWTLDVAAVGDTVYGAVGGPGGRLVAWNAASGSRRWVAYADGDVQAVAVSGPLVYAGGHFAPNFDGGKRNMLAAVVASTGKLDPNFVTPMRTAYPGVLGMATTPSALVIVGDITYIGGTAQARVGIFPVLQ